MSTKKSTLADLDEYIHVSSPSLTITILALCAVFVAINLWLIFGSVTDVANIKGIIFPGEGTVSVNVPHAGLVRTVYVHKGDKVTQGQPLALVSIGSSYSILTSPQDGEILNFINENSSFEPFESIVNLVSLNTESACYQIIGFCDFRTSRKAAPGIPAQATPSQDTRERIGYINGKVSHVFQYPVSEKEAKTYLDDATIVQEIFPKEGSAYLINIDLDPDPDDPTGVDWSFKGKDAAEVGVGTYCDVRIILKRRSFFEYLLENASDKKRITDIWLR